MVLSSGSAALADRAPPLVFGWSAPDGDECPDRAAVEHEIGRMLGPDDGNRKAVTAEANVVRRAVGDYRVSLLVTTDETRSTRSFKATSCREASEATALIVALAIDSRAKAPEPAVSAPESAPPPPIVREATPVAPGANSVRSVAPPVRESSSIAPARTREIALGGLVSGRLSSGMQPDVALGFEGGLFGAWGAWRLEALFAYQPATRARVAESPNKGGDVSSVSVGGRGCHLFSSGARWGIGPCLSAGVLRATGTAFGTERATSGSASWGTLSAEAMARVAFGSRFALRATVGPTLALDRPTFVIETGSGKIPVFRPDALGFSAHVGLEARFF